MGEQNTAAGKLEVVCITHYRRDTWYTSPGTSTPRVARQERT
jgi:hypothetical protein